MHQYSQAASSLANAISRKRRLSFTDQRPVSSSSPPMMMMTRTPPWDHDNDMMMTTVMTTPTADKAVAPLCYSPEVYPDSPASCPDDSDSEAVLPVGADAGDAEDDESCSGGFEPTPKVPRYVGTIYEERLAPLSPVTALPVHTNTLASSCHRRADSAAQARLLGLVAAGTGVEAELETFLEEHAHLLDMNLYGEDGVTPLQRLCQAGGPVGVARLLVRYGADVRLTSRDGWSPLHMASFAGNTQLMMYLLRCPK
jgi:hypothetical protein